MTEFNDKNLPNFLKNYRNLLGGDCPKSYTFEREFKVFINYVFTFYKKKYTLEQIKKATLIYFFILDSDLAEITWGSGDSIDRQRVKAILDLPYMFTESAIHLPR